MEQQIKHKGEIINFQVSGKGNCIVLLHGFLESLKIWNHFIKSLSIEFKAVTIDLPGHGKTGNFSKNHSMDLMAEIVRRILDHLNIKECIIVGHSMGGYVSLSFAQNHPDLLRGICLFHSQAAADSEEAQIIRDRTIKIVNKSRKNFIQLFIPDLFAADNRKIHAKEIEALKKQAELTSKKGIIAALEGMKQRKDNTDTLRNFNKPVLFIHGKEDSRIPVSTIMQQSCLPYRCSVHLLGGVGHMGYIEAREETLEYIKQFSRHAFTRL